MATNYQTRNGKHIGLMVLAQPAGISFNRTRWFLKKIVPSFYQTGREAYQSMFGYKKINILPHNGNQAH